jgi:AraC family transcriptional regulator, melibiose operon regulatory protein
MTQWPLSDAVEEMPAGLWIRRGPPPPMHSMHRHDDVEINVVLDGRLQYLFGGRPLTVREGEIAVFWAAQPHGLVDSRTGDMCWVHVPFSMFLSWGLPEAQIAPLLSAQPLITHAPALALRIAHTAERWGEEVGGAEPGGAEADEDDSAQIALLEIQAAVRRILRASSLARPRPPADGAGSVPATRLRQVSAMAQHVRENHRSRLAIADIAAAVHLTPSHAMTVFRRTAGVTLGDYVTMCRVAEAQRLLLTTSMTVTEIAEAAGFGSLSSFYEHVSAACGMTPREYRRQGR